MLLAYQSKLIFALTVNTILLRKKIFRDAKIAALEKTGQESEKLIAEARSDRLKQMEEVHTAQKKVSELESRYYNLTIMI